MQTKVLKIILTAREVYACFFRVKTRNTNAKNNYILFSLKVVTLLPLRTLLKTSRLYPPDCLLLP